MEADLLTQLLTPANLMCQVAAAAAMAVLSHLAPKLVAMPWYARISPLLPIVLCAIAVALLPVEEWEAKLLGERILLGITLGVGAAWAHKFVRQSLFGSDSRIPADPKSAVVGKIGTLALVGSLGGYAAVQSSEPHVVPMPAAAVYMDAKAAAEPPIMDLVDSSTTSTRCVR